MHRLFEGLRLIAAADLATSEQSDLMRNNPAVFGPGPSRKGVHKNGVLQWAVVGCGKSRSPIDTNRHTLPLNKPSAQRRHMTATKQHDATDALQTGTSHGFVRVRSLFAASGFIFVSFHTRSSFFGLNLFSDCSLAPGLCTPFFLVGETRLVGAVVRRWQKRVPRLPRTTALRRRLTRWQTEPTPGARESKHAAEHKLLHTFFLMDANFFGPGIPHVFFSCGSTSAWSSARRWQKRVPRLPRTTALRRRLTRWQTEPRLGARESKHAAEQFCTIR